MKMSTGTKIGIIGVVTSAVISITFGIMDIKDSRNGKKRMNKDDIDMIATSVAIKQKELGLINEQKLEVKK